MRIQVTAPFHVNVDLLVCQLQWVHMTKLLPFVYQVHSSLTALAVVQTQLGHTIVQICILYFGYYNATIIEWPIFRKFNQIRFKKMISFIYITYIFIYSTLDIFTMISLGKWPWNSSRYFTLLFRCTSQAH